MGARRTRAASSCALGGGSCESTQTDRPNKGKNKAPAAAGIQNGLTRQPSMSNLPTDFTAPEETMKLAHKIAPNTSDVRRPSMKPNTRPQIIPKGRPFKNIVNTFQGAGMTANRMSASQEIKIKTRMAPARLLGVISAITFTPISFETA